jgi:HEAT repeat protein
MSARTSPGASSPPAFQKEAPTPFQKAITDLSLCDLTVALASSDLDPAISQKVRMDAISFLAKAFLTVAHSKRDEVGSMIIALFDGIPADDAVVDLILHSLRTPCGRFLAIRLLPLVRNAAKIRNPFFTLTLDRQLSVRCAVVRALKSGPFDQPTIDVLLRNALKDKCLAVRIAALEELPTIAPHFMQEFQSGLESEVTAPAALSGLRQMAAVHAFTPFAAAVTAAGRIKPDETVLALSAALDSITAAEEPLLLACLSGLTQSQQFILHFGEFADRVSEKGSFIQLIEVKSIKRWRDRLCYMKQLLKFVRCARNEVTESACAFAGDEAAVVRNASVELWLELIGQDRATASRLAKLAGEGWQTRLVAAKVIGRLGPLPELEELQRQLGADPVESVRLCIEASSADGAKQERGLNSDAAELPNTL